MKKTNAMRLLTEKDCLQAPLLQLLLSEQKIGYVIVDHHLTVLNYGGKLTVFLDTQDLRDPLPLLDFIPELNGCEEILQDILNGVLPSFQLENLNRTLPDDGLCYLNLTLLRYAPTASFDANPQLLVILADTSAWAQTQQILTQQRNELSLLKHTLNETNQRLEFILQYYVPREVGKALMEKRIVPKLGGEEREVTALFADLRNYTSISEQLTPNQTIEMLHVCLDIATTAIAESGGVVVNYMGDAVMAIFNAPNEQADHAQRAVQAGLTIQAMMALYQQNTDNMIPSLHFGVGINTGIAVVGNIGAQWHYQYTAIGDSINVASRICSHARPNEVLIGTNTYAYVQNNITAQALAPLKFKGKSQEITVYQVIELANNSLIQSLKKTLVNHS
ncbi:MAG TPA: adenylate/guanylate cyclase domain-containing protein [Thiotrichaceae bacterium]|nr:adenylate/guanylate cyclase domain-containing protein [Thiotrichaceae bacterium]